MFHYEAKYTHFLRILVYKPLKHKSMTLSLFLHSHVSKTPFAMWQGHVSFRDVRQIHRSFKYQRVSPKQLLTFPLKHGLHNHSLPFLPPILLPLNFLSFFLFVWNVFLCFFELQKGAGRMKLATENL